MWIFDERTYRFLKVNEAAVASYGYSQDEFLGMTIADIRPAEDSTGLIESRKDQPGFQNPGIWRHRKKNGEIIFVNTSHHPIVFRGHRAMLVLSLNIARQIEADNSLRNQNAELEKKIEERTRELIEANHELAASNEELTQLNEELSTSNDHLNQANETILQQKEIIIQQKDEQLNHVLDSVDDVVWSFDLKGHEHSYLSRSAERIFEKPLNELKQKQGFWKDYIWGEDQEIKNRSDQKLYETGYAESTYRIGNNGAKWIYERSRLHFDANGKPLRLEGIASDVTALKEAEEAVRQSELRFRLALDSMIEGCQIIDFNWRYVYVNDTAAAQGRSTPEKLTGKTMMEAYSGIERTDMFAILTQCMQTRTSQFLENRFQYEDGTSEWFELRIHPSSQGLFILSINISDRKNGEEKIKESERRFRSWVENVSDGISVSDEASRVIYQSPSVTRILGYTNEERAGNPILNYVHPEDRPKMIQFLSELKNKPGQPQEFQYRGLHKDGRTVWIEGVITNLLNEPTIKAFVANYRDITERKEAERNIRHLVEQYDMLALATNDAIWDWNMKTGTVAWNHGLKTIFGYETTVEDSLPSWLFDKMHPEDQERVRTEVNSCFESKEVNWSSIYRFLSADGRYKYIQNRAYIAYVDESPSRMIGAMQDIDERMNYLEEVKKLSLIASKTQDSVIITDKNNRVEWVNNAFSQLTGYSYDEIVGKEPGQILQGIETDPHVRQRIREKMRTCEPVTEEIINYSKTGRKYWLKLSITPIFSEQGDIEKFISVQSDITARKEFEINITAIARELANLIENANAMIIGVDRSGYINEWNKQAVHLTGFSKYEVFGKKIFEFISDSEKANTFVTSLKKLMEEQPINNYELPLRTKSGKSLIVLMNGTLRKNAEQVVVGSLLVGQNITELIEYRYHLEQKVEERTQKLNEAMEKEKELVSIQSKFVSIASHEFRTPLATIALATGYIRKYNHKLDQEALEHKLENIEQQVKHMTFLLDDVLTIGKSDAGKIVVRTHLLKAPDFFKTILADVEESFSNSHRIDFKYEPEGFEFISDEKLMRNILINLLNNAIKFSPEEKHVMLRVEKKPDMLVLQVKDHGIGIPENDLHKIFEPFNRAENVGTIRGTGLGLSIVKKAVDLLKGTISVVSESGQGTQFTITLPLIKHEENNAR